MRRNDFEKRLQGSRGAELGAGEAVAGRTGLAPHCPGRGCAAGGKGPRDSGFHAARGQPSEGKASRSLKEQIW